MKLVYKVLLTSFFVLMGKGQTAGASAPISVDANLYSHHWLTIFNNEVPLTWEWPDNANTASLEIRGMNSLFTTNFITGETSFLWQPPMPTATSEDIYDISLTFYSRTFEEVGLLESQLATLTGALTPAVIDAVPDSKSWSRVNGNPVISYDSTWSKTTAATPQNSLVVRKDDSIQQTISLPEHTGYFGWQLAGTGLGYGNFMLSLLFSSDGPQWDAELFRNPAATVLQIK